MKLYHGSVVTVKNPSIRQGAESKEYGISQKFPVIETDRLMEEIPEQDVRLIPEICAQLGNRCRKENSADSHNLSEHN